MISPEVLVLMMEMQMASGMTYRSPPLSEARRRAQRLIFSISALSIPALVFAALGLAIFLSGKVPPIVGLIELTIIGLNAAIQVILYRHLLRLRKLSRLDIGEYQDDWRLFTEAEDLIASKNNKAFLWTLLGCVPIVTAAAAPLGIVYAAEALQLIRYFGVGQSHRRAMQAITVINVAFLLLYASLLALLPLLLIRAN